MATSWKARLASKQRRAEISNPPWEGMLKEQGVRDRIARENPNALKVLDHLRTVYKPFTDHPGMTTFNDWLDLSYNMISHKWPEGLPRFNLETLRQVVFPAARDTQPVTLVPTRFHGVVGS